MSLEQFVAPLHLFVLRCYWNSHALGGSSRAPGTPHYFAVQELQAPMLRSRSE